MGNHEIVREMTKPQLKALVVTLGSAAPDNLSFQAAQFLIGNQGAVVDAVQQAIMELLCGISPSQRLVKPAFPAYPKDGVVFELTLDGGAPENQPLKMVRRFGYNPEGWRHNGRQVTGKQTRRFKLEGVGYCQNLAAVQEKLQAHGKNPEGQWIEAFKAAFPQPDGQGPIGVADPSWVDPNGRASFPCVDADGRLDFRWADDDQGGGWRWLVPA